MANLVQLEEQLLAHDLERADLARILLLGQIDLAIATLSDLGQDLEVGVAEANATLAQIGPLPACVLVPQLFVLLFVGLGRRGDFSLESVEALLAVADIGQKIEVVVQEVYGMLDMRRSGNT